MDAMDLDTEMVISDDEVGPVVEPTVSEFKSGTDDKLSGRDTVKEITTYSEAAKTWLSGLKWKPYPPLLAEQPAFRENDNFDIDSTEGLSHLFSDCSTESGDANLYQVSLRPPTPLLHHNIEHSEFIFTMLQKFASITRTFIGPLTQSSFLGLSNFSSQLIDDALSGDDERIHNALVKLVGDLSSRDTIIGELIDERKWDVAEDIAADCVDTITCLVAQDVDFYRPAPGVDRADPVFSLILAETDWLLYEMVCFIGDEHADMSLYDDHFYGPSKEEKKVVFELQMKKKQEQERQQITAAPVPEVYAAFVSPVLPEHHFGYNYIAPPLESPVLDPATASYWQTYYDYQQQTAFVQAAAYSYTAKQRAQMVVAQAQANSSNYQQPQLPQPSLQSSVAQTQSKNTSLAVKFVQSALKTKASAPKIETKTVAPSIQKSKHEEKDSRDRRDRDRTDRHRDRDRSKSAKKRSADDDDDERLEGPFYCMVTNLRNDARASDVEHAVSKVGRIETVKVLRDKGAQPPENALASITFRYVYKAAFDKLLSTGLDFGGKYRPIARLQADPFASSK